MNKIYLIGSLRNPQVPVVASELRKLGFDVYDDWYAVGPEADDRWKEYEIDRGHDYVEAMRGWHAHHVFTMDKEHLDAADGCVMVYPAGKSAHLEFGYMIGQGKWGLVLLDDVDRWDIMLQFASGLCENLEDLKAQVVSYHEVGF